MNKNNALIFVGAAALSMVLVILLRTASNTELVENLQSEPAEQSNTSDVNKKKKPALKIKKPADRLAGADKETRIRALMAKVGIPRHLVDDNYLFMIDAFELGNKELVAQHMRELLEKDIHLALDTMAKLDGLFLMYKTELPSQEVADYLNEKFTGPERMELLAKYLNSSVSIREIGGKVFCDWANEDRVGQRQWIRENQPFNDRFILNQYFTQEMAGEYAGDAARFLTDLPEGDTRANDMVHDALKLWAVSQPENFAEFASTMDPEDTRADDAIHVYASYAAKLNGPAAMEWAASLANEDCRYNAQVMAGSTFKVHDPEGFQKWADETEFGSKEEREKTLELIEHYAEVERTYEPGEKPNIGADITGIPLDHILEPLPAGEAPPHEWTETPHRTIK